MTACPTCGEAAEVVVVPEAATSAGSVTVRLLGTPILRCPAGHRDFFTTDLDLHLAAGVQHHLVDAVAVRLRRRDRCAACGARLELAPRTTERPVPVALRGGVVTVVVEAPMVRCGECGQEQVPSHVTGHIRRGVTAAAEAARDRP